MYTGNLITLTKVSNGILPGLTVNNKTCVTKFYKFVVVLFKKIIHENRH